MLKQIALLLMIALLTSCASARTQQQLQLGEIKFQDGDFKQSIQQLLPLAAEGQAKAQYAVGYMYYYGFGVAEDPVSGTFWIEKSAAQGYPPAVKAMKMLKR